VRNTQLLTLIEEKTEKKRRRKRKEVHA